MADTSEVEPEPGAEQPAGSLDEPTSALRRLKHHAFFLLAGLLASLIVGVAAVVVLVDAPSTTDLQKLGLIAAAAGLAGGSARGVIEVAGLVRQGFRAGDVLVIYDSSFRSLYDDEKRQYERDVELYQTAQAAPAEARSLGRLARPSPPFDPPVFSAELISQYLIIPFTGVAFGVVVFAGVVGGFLVASTAAASYSPPALAFLAFLGGMFSDQFLGKLASTAHVLFGDDSQASQRRSDA